jgi:hypothetical protein
MNAPPHLEVLQFARNTALELEPAVSFHSAFVE